MRKLLIALSALALFACEGEGGQDETDPVDPQLHTMQAEGEPSPAPSVEAPIEKTQAAPQRYGYRVVGTLPHDVDDFTQGLFIHDGVLYESTGRRGASALIRHDTLGTATAKRHLLPREVFGEGSVAVGDRIISLTWRDGIGYVHDLATFEPEATFPIEGEGWGLTYDGSRLIMSDGTNRLRFLDPETFEETGAVGVTANGRPVPRLNELEYIDGEVWANVWQTEVIVRIDPADGRVTGFVNLAGLHQGTDPTDDVLNGIAYDPASGRLFVTGKRWDTIYEIEVTPAP
jgi:glutamine cyclotransferase